MTRALVLATLALVAIGCARDHRSEDAKRQPNAVRIVATESRDKRGDYATLHTERELHPPAIEVDTPPAKGTSPGYIFLTPRTADTTRPSGPTILDSQGRLAWFLPSPGRVTSSLQAQTFKGRPVLT